MSHDKVPTSKIERASRFLRTGAKVGVNYAKHYGTRVFDKNADRGKLDEANAKDIFDEFSELRGSALKIAQMLSVDTINLSASFTNVLQKAQYSVPPMSGPLAVQAFRKSMGKSPEEVFDKFSPNAKKAASMGQVHEAEKDGMKLAVKIQYPGVADSIKSDIKMVKSIAPRIARVKSSELEPYFQEVESKLLEEADYRKELQNSVAFKAECEGLDGILFPDYFEEWSSDRVITMKWMPGIHLKEFLDQKPSEEMRHKVAKNLWDFYEFQIHKLRKVNADPHPGNFLIQEDGSICVLDFGCTKALDDELYENYFAMADPYLFDDMENAKQLFRRLELLRPDDTPEKEKKVLNIFQRLLQLISRPYHEGRFNFNEKAFYDKMMEVSKEISEMRDVRGSKDFLFINRTYMGLYAFFRELDVTLETACQYRDFLRK